MKKEEEEEIGISTLHFSKKIMSFNYSSCGDYVFITL